MPLWLCRLWKALLSQQQHTDTLFVNCLLGCLCWLLKEKNIGDFGAWKNHHKNGYGLIRGTYLHNHYYTDQQALKKNPFILSFSHHTEGETPFICKSTKIYCKHFFLAQNIPQNSPIFYHASLHYKEHCIYLLLIKQKPFSFISMMETSNVSRPKFLCLVIK